MTNHTSSFAKHVNIVGKSTRFSSLIKLQAHTRLKTLSAAVSLDFD